MKTFSYWNGEKLTERDSWPAFGQLMAYVREVFDIKTIDVGGLTDREAVIVLDSFLDHLGVRRISDK